MTPDQNIPPSQKDILLRIYSIRTNEKEVDELDIEQAWTLEELKKEQEKDTLLKPIMDYLKSPSKILKMKIEAKMAKKIKIETTSLGERQIRVDWKREEPKLVKLEELGKFPVQSVFCD